jgi:hypothetical protein
MSDQFYLTLPSDSSTAYYPENTIATYATKLPERIGLDGQYEVGLCELVYPHTWFNVDNGGEIYWIGALDTVTNRLVRTYIKSGYYSNGEEFASSLTHQATRALTDVSIKFTFVEPKSRIRMQIWNSDDRMVILWVERNQCQRNTKSYVPKQLAKNKDKTVQYLDQFISQYTLKQHMHGVLHQCRS